MACKIKKRIRERVKARERKDEREREYERISKKANKGREILLSFLLVGLKSLSRGPFPWRQHPLRRGFSVCVPRPWTPSGRFSRFMPNKREREGKCPSSLLLLKRRVTVCLDWVQSISVALIVHGAFFPGLFINSVRERRSGACIGTSSRNAFPRHQLTPISV